MGYRVPVVTLLGVLSGCFIGVDGNGHRVTESRRVREVSRVENNSSLDVDISQGDAFEVRVRIDSNLQRVVDVWVSDDTLQIDTDTWLADPSSGPHVLITMPRIERLEQRGSGDMFAAWFEQEDDVALRLAGSGDMRFEGSVPRIRADLHGSGDIQLSGSTEFAELTVQGSGDLDASDLVAAGADLTVEGSGDLRARVDGQVDARVKGSGDVDISGDVERGNFSEHGSGHIQVH